MNVYRPLQKTEVAKTWLYLYIIGKNKITITLIEKDTPRGETFS